MEDPTIRRICWLIRGQHYYVRFRLQEYSAVREVLKAWVLDLDLDFSAKDRDTCWRMLKNSVFAEQYGGSPPFYFEEVA